MKIAVIGGMDFDEAKLEAFVYALDSKYPHATIVTGHGRGAEKAVKTLAEAIGMTVVVPELNDALYGKSANDCQVFDILIECDRIVVIGSPSGSRQKAALDWHKRCYSHPIKEGPESPLWKPLYQVAVPPAKKKAAAARKASKPDRLAA